MLTQIRCKQCIKMKNKTYDLKQAYEKLITVKDIQLIHSKKIIQGLQEQIHHLQLQLSKIQPEEYNKRSQQDRRIISYFQNRQVELVAIIAKLENALFIANNSIPKLQLPQSEQTSQKSSQGDLNARPKYSPLVISEDKTFKKSSLILKQLTNLQDQNSLLNLKHRLAILRASQISSLNQC